MENDGTLLTIGELARRVGVPVRTIRFWSDSGLVPPASRTDGDRRLYDAACVARLELVTTLRDLGVSLASVRSVLDGQATAAAVAAVSWRRWTPRSGSCGCAGQSWPPW